MFRRVTLAILIFVLAGSHVFRAEDKVGQSSPATTQIGPTEQPADPNAFSDRVAAEVLNEIRDGLEGHSQRLMLSAFDRDRMDGYLTFEDQVQAYFEHYEGFRVRFHVIQASSEDDKGIVLAEFEIEGSPRGGGPVMRRSNQIRFELQRGKKGWKIVDFRPRAFFA